METPKDDIQSDVVDDDAFGLPRPILVVTADDVLAASLFAALDQLTCTSVRVGDLREAERLCRTQPFELLLIDVCADDRPRNDNDDAGAGVEAWQPPFDLLGALNAETPWLPVARGGRQRRSDAIACYDGGLGTHVIAQFIQAELDRAAEKRLLNTAQILVSAPGRLSAVPIPPALEAAHRLDAMYVKDPSLDHAAAVVERQEHLAKHVIRLAHALSGDADMRSWDVRRVMLHLGLMRVLPLVNIVAARSLFQVRNADRRATLDEIWRYSVARGIAMRWLAPRLNVSGRLAFDAGLFADAGASLLVWLQDQSEPRRPRTRVAGHLSPQMAAEHEWFGEKLLDRWRMRRSISQFAGGHHAGNGALASLGTLSLAAVAVVDDAEIGVDPSRPVVCGAVGQAFDQLGVSSADRQHVTSLVRVEIARIEEAFVL